MGYPTTTTVQLASPKVYLWPDGTKPPIDVSKWCAGFRCTKALSQPTGQWSLTLLPYSTGRNMVRANDLPDLARLVRPNSLVSIGMEEAGGICLGLVDQLPRTIRSGGPTVGYGFEISGSDFGKLLTTDNIINSNAIPATSGPDFLADVGRVVGEQNSLLHQLRAKFGPVSGAAGERGFYGADLEDVINWVLREGPAAMQIPLVEAWGSTGRVGSIVKTLGSVTTWNQAKLFSTGVQDFQGNVWGFLKSIVDEDFYEIVIDSRPYAAGPVSRPLPSVGRVPEIHLTVRPKPFDSKWLSGAPYFLPVSDSAPIGLTWETLKTRIDGAEHWRIPRSQILDEHLGISDADVMSYYCVAADHDLLSSPAAAAMGLFYPIVDLFALQRAGLRAYQGRMSLASGDVIDADSNDLLQEAVARSDAENFRNRLFNWYRLAEYFESGTITTVGRDRFRVGDPVYLPDHIHMRQTIPSKGVRFYCTSTTHSWQAGGAYTTSLQLQRGHNLAVVLRAKEDILKAWKDSGVRHNGMMAVAR